LPDPYPGHSENRADVPRVASKNIHHSLTSTTSIPTSSFLFVRLSQPFLLHAFLLVRIIIMMKNLHGLSLFLSFFSIASASFNLNTSGPDWDYTAKDLANTTSQTFKDAYSANIDCDPTLHCIVASMHPAFKPTAPTSTGLAHPHAMPLW
jgi:hypothetical protein